MSAQGPGHGPAGPYVNPALKNVDSIVDSYISGWGDVIT